MGRLFDFEYEGRKLSIHPISGDEGWELWIMEGEKRLVCGGWITVDEVVLAGRRGEDRIETAAQQIRQQIVAGELGIAVPDPSAA